MKKTDKELLIRIDERVANIVEGLDEHNKKIERVCNDVNSLTVKTESLETTLNNHVGMHKRDIAIIGVGLTILSLIISVTLRVL